MTTTIKCSLGRLECTPDLRKQIEKVVEHLHVLAVRGSVVATETLLSELREGRCPPVNEQSWWYRCFANCGALRGKRQTCKEDDSIENSIQRLFGSSSLVDASHMWPFIAELSKEALTMSQNMLASNFHRELTKAIRREVTLHEKLSSSEIPKDVRYTLITHYMRLLTGHQDQSPKPTDAPEELLRQLDALAKKWLDLFGKEVLPCPTEAFIYNDGKRIKMRGIICWMYALQEHRAACLQTLQQSLDPAQVKTAREILGSAAKPVGLLPVYSFHMKHIAVSNTGLKSLLAAIKIKEGDFFSHFPGLTRYHREDKKTFENFFRTDGVSACLVMKRTEGSASKRKRKKEREVLNPEPIRPTEGQRVVGIDPGRRDAVAVVAGTEEFTVSTKSIQHDTGSLMARRLTRNVLRKRKIGGDTLLAKLEELPSRRDIYEWDAYVSEVLPLLPDILEAYKTRELRRVKFTNYMKRDRALDTVCKRITGCQRDALIAFGAANTCSTGFGHAPAPQSRLRWRLEKIHGARITMVDEYRTSQVCCRCHQQLKVPTAGHYDDDVECSTRLQKMQASHRLKRTIRCGRNLWHEKLHGVRYCGSCKNSKGAPQFWHRDFNAARNILECYLSVARTGVRPEVFRRQGLEVRASLRSEAAKSKRVKRSS